MCFCKECCFHGEKGRIFNPLHEEEDFAAFINPFVTMIRQLLDDSMLLFMGNDKFVKVPIAALAGLKRHPSEH